MVHRYPSRAQLATIIPFLCFALLLPVQTPATAADNGKLRIAADKALHLDLSLVEPAALTGPFTVHIYLLRANGRREHVFTATDVKMPYHYAGNALERDAQYLVEVVDQSSPQLLTGTFGTQISHDTAPHSKSKADRFIFLRKGVSGESHDEPATVSFLKDRGQDPTFAVDFAVLAERDRRTDLPVPGTWMVPSASFEGHLGSPGLSEQALRFRLGTLINTTSVHYVTENGLSDIAKQDFGTRTRLGFKFETDQALRSKKVSGELLFQPTKFDLGMGQFVTLSRHKDGKRATQFLWRPVLGLEGGGTLDSANSKEKESTLLRAKAQAGAIFRINPKGGILQHIDLTADDFFYFLPLESGRSTYNFFRTGIIFHFNDTYSFNVNYKVGEDAPTFQKVESVEGAFGVKF